MPKLYIFLLTLLIFLLSYFRFDYLNSSEIATKSRRDPIEYMKNLKIYCYDQQGMLKNHILAIHWEFSPNYAMSKLQEPEVIIFKMPDHRYKIQANYGEIVHKANPAYIDKTFDSDITTIKLFANVVIQQQYLNDLTKLGFKIDTQQLEFDPNLDIASTTKEVTINRPGLLISGTGMIVNLKTQEIELQHKVKSKYNKQAYLNIDSTRYA